MKPPLARRIQHGHLQRKSSAGRSARSFGDCTFKDLEISGALGGADWDGKTDLEYVNEHDAENPRLGVLPIFGVPLTVNEEVTATAGLRLRLTADRCLRHRCSLPCAL